MSGIFLVRKLNAFIPLRTDGERAIEGLASKRVKSLPRGHDIISEGEDPKTVNLIVDGWACRYKILKDGRRQILAFFVPGDLADLIVYMSTYWMRWIIPSGPSRLCNMQCSPPAEFEKLGDDPPRVLRALWRDSLLTASIQREWLVSVRQRNAVESIAHLTCELFLRLKIVGLAENGLCRFPLTQADIGDALGMTQPHVSRTFKDLHASGVATIQRGTLRVNDIEGLRKLAVFNPNYLHHLYAAAL